MGRFLHANATIDVMIFGHLCLQLGWRMPLFICVTSWQHRACWGSSRRWLDFATSQHKDNAASRFSFFHRVYTASEFKTFQSSCCAGTCCPVCLSARFLLSVSSDSIP